MGCFVPLPPPPSLPSPFYCHSLSPQFPPQIYFLFQFPLHISFFLLFLPSLSLTLPSPLISPFFFASLFPLNFPTRFIPSSTSLHLVLFLISFLSSLSLRSPFASPLHCHSLFFQFPLLTCFLPHFPWRVLHVFLFLVFSTFSSYPRLPSPLLSYLFNPTTYFLSLLCLPCPVLFSLQLLSTSLFLSLPSVITSFLTSLSFSQLWLHYSLFYTIFFNSFLLSLDLLNRLLIPHYFYSSPSIPSLFPIYFLFTLFVLTPTLISRLSSPIFPPHSSFSLSSHWPFLHMPPRPRRPTST